MHALSWRRTDRSARVRYLARRPEYARKLRLFSVACCRRIWDRLADGRSRTAVEAAERLADGLASESEAHSASKTAQAACRSAVAAYVPTGQGMSAREQAAQAASQAAVYAAQATAYCLGGQADLAAEYAAQAAACTVPRATHGSPGWAMAFMAAATAERKAQKALLDDLIGDPFGPAHTLDPAWLTRDVRALAEAIYLEHRFADLPVLADALEEAGCAGAGVLRHLREPGPHALGCWALDLAVGRR